MGWPPSEFRRATPYDCLLAANGKAATMSAGNGKTRLTKKDVAELKQLLVEHQAGG